MFRYDAQFSGRPDNLFRSQRAGDMLPILPAVHGAERHTKLAGELLLSEPRGASDLLDEEGVVERCRHAEQYPCSVSYLIYDMRYPHLVAAHRRRRPLASPAPLGPLIWSG